MKIKKLGHLDKKKRKKRRTSGDILNCMKGCEMTVHQCKHCPLCATSKNTDNL